MDETNLGRETPIICDVCSPENVIRRTAIRRDTPLGRHRQTLARSQHAPMEIKTNECPALQSQKVSES